MKSFFSTFSIQTKLILLILGIVTSIVLVLSSVIAYTTTQLLQEDSKRQLLQSEKQSIHLLNTFLGIRGNNLEIWGSNPLVNSIFQNAAFAGVFLPSLRAQFEEIKSKEPWFMNFLLIQDDSIIYDDSEGFVLSDGSDGTPDGMKRLKELPASGMFAMNLKELSADEDLEVLLIKRPFIRNGTEVEGLFMVNIIDIEIVSETLFGNFSIGKRGFIALTAESTFVDSPIVIPPLKVGVEVDDFLKFTSERSPSELSQEYASIIIQFRKLENYPVSVVGIVSLNDLSEPIIHLLQLSTLFGGIALIFGLLSAIFFSAKLTRPIRELTQKAEKMSHRELGGVDSLEENKNMSSYLKVLAPKNVQSLFTHTNKKNHRKDELGVLQSSFDTMVQKIEDDTKRILEDRKQILSITGTFEKFVPKQFLARITEGGFENIELGKAESAVITILFSDIRSFTNLSEDMSPQELLDFLNGYLKRMNQPIHDHGGFIDKFIGDAIMALFDHPNGTDAEEARDAVLAAIEMQSELKKYNEDRKKSGKIEIKIGIGIHSGPVIIGTIGSEDRMDSTVLGDSVNLASRIEGLTKKYGAGILISGATLDLLENPSDFKLRKLDTVCVKGKTEAVSIYEVYDYEDLVVQKKKYASSVYLMKGLADRSQQNWGRATQAFEKALEIYPEDKAITTHLEYIADLKKLERLEDWNGVISLDEK